MKNNPSHQKWMDERRRKYIYVLKLEGDKYYIGQCEDPASRLKKQFSGKGSRWTRINEPLEVLVLKPIGDLTYREAEIKENILALRYMKHVGWQNVRGGFFTFIDDEVTRKNLINHKKKNTFGRYMDFFEEII